MPFGPTVIPSVNSLLRIVRCLHRPVFHSFAYNVTYFTIFIVLYLQFQPERPFAVSAARSSGALEVLLTSASRSRALFGGKHGFTNNMAGASLLISAYNVRYLV